MKNFGKLLGFISIIAIIMCAMAACELFPEPEQTPVAGDYDIANLTQAAGSVIAVAITPKSGKSSGARTVYYAGTGTTTYAKSTTLPTAAGTYAVTFDVAAASGWKAATGLSAGTLTIGTPTPAAGDYEVNGLAQTFGSVTAVTITPKAGKSSGARTIYYAGTGSTTYTKSATLPTERGTYAVTFDVAAATGWNAATGLAAGTLEINDNPTPVASHYDVGNLTQSAASATAVTITPKAGNSSGARTIYYAGTGSTTYVKSTALPTAVGTYAVTFDVAAASGWNAATGLAAGTLVLNNNPTPVAGDYDIGNLTQTAGSGVIAVTITPKSGKSNGARIIYYEGIGGTTYAKNTLLPTAAGNYAVTFDVAAVTGWNAATGISAGTLVLSSVPIPVAADYVINSNGWAVIFDEQGARTTTFNGSLKALSITAKSGKSTGAVKNVKYGTSTTPPFNVGTYVVTFDVEAAAGWSAATNLSAGTLKINKYTFDSWDFDCGELEYEEGDLPSNFLNDIEIYHWGQLSPSIPGIGNPWDSIVLLNKTITGYQKYVPSSGYIRLETPTPPTTAGDYRIEVKFDVQAGTNWNSATNLTTECYIRITSP